MTEEEMEHGRDASYTCKGPQGYKVYIFFSAALTHLRIENESQKFDLSLPEQSQADALSRTIDWRLADGKPFAVIFRVSKYKELGSEVSVSELYKDKDKIGESLHVFGLKGFEGLKQEIPIKKGVNANQLAHDAADNFHKKNAK